MASKNIFEKFLDLNKPAEQLAKENTPTQPNPLSSFVPNPTPVVQVPKKKEKPKRTVGDINLMAEAQRVYNPNLPPTKPKGPTEAQTQLGVTANSGLEGRWGTVGE